MARRTGTAPRLSVFIGIEGGATRATAVAADESGHELARVGADAIVVRGGDQSVTANALARLIATVLARARSARAQAISCNLTGAGRADERLLLQQALSALRLAETVAVGTDAEAALADAFQDGPGLLLIAGTGSIAWGRGPNGDVARAGGWGPIGGDEGSAWAIGQNALHAVFAAYDGRAEETALTRMVLDSTGVENVPLLVRWADDAGKKGVASLARVVIEAAPTDSVARALYDSAVKDLAMHVTALVARLEPWLGEHIPCALAGGLLASGRPMRDAVRRRIMTLVPTAAILDRDIDGARGAAWLARRLVDS
jgi:glucosamine kinase